MEHAYRSAWDVLGIDATVDERSIKRAYAKLLKATRPEDSAEQFQCLRDAYEYALRTAAQDRQDAQDEPGESEAPQRQPATALTTPAERPSPALTQSDNTPDLMPVDAVAVAERLWLHFVPTAHVSPRQKLKQLASEEALLNLLTQEALEVCAARYCGGDACPSNVREATVEHFGWHEDNSHLSRLQPGIAGEVMNRYHADRQYDRLLPASSEDAALWYLMSNDHANNAVHAIQLSWGPFTRALRRHAQTIRWYYPDLLRHRLNQATFSWWEQKAHDKRYFLDTALYSIVAGLLIQGLLGLALSALVGLDIEFNWTTAALGQLSGFALLATLAFRPPQRLYSKLAQFRADIVGNVWHTARYRHRWQHGWMPLFFAFSMLLLCHEPGPAARVIVLGGLLTSCAGALFAASVVFRPANYGFVLVMAAVLTAAIHYDPYGPIASLAFWLTVFTQMLRGGEQLYSLSRFSGRALLAARVTWLAGFAAIYLSSDALGDAALAALAWTWSFLGLTLIRAGFTTALIWPGIIMVRIFLSQGSRRFDNLPHSPLSLLLTLMAIITFFMLQNMYYAKTKDLPFS
jgi:hypothetical protein